MENMKILNWLLENSKGIDLFFTIFGVLIEVLITVAIYLIYKNYKKNKDEK